jgi:hypothetical protein
LPLPVSNILLENYDLAVWEWLGGVLVDYGTEFGKGYVTQPKSLTAHPIFRIFSSAERAFSDNRIGLKSQGFFNTVDYAKIDNVTEDNVISLSPLPCVRIQRKGLGRAAERHNTPGVLQAFASEGTSFLQRRWPVPYSLSYEIEFYSRTRMTGNYLEQWFANQFEQRGAGMYQRFLTVRNPKPYGEKIVPMDLESVVDTSDLTAEKADERFIRFLATVDVLFLNFDLTGETLPNNGRVRAIYSINAPTNALDGSDLDLDVFGEELNPSLAARPVRMLNYRLVQPRHTPPPKTTAKLLVMRHTDVQYAAQYQLASDSDVVQIVSLPFLANDLVQTSIGVKWRNEDGTDPGPLTAEVLWVDVATGVETVKQTLTLPYVSDLRGNALEFATAPGSESREVAVRFRRATGSPSQRMSLGHWRVWRSRIVNAVASPNRTLGPNLVSAVNRVTASGLVSDKPYIAKADVTVGSQAVTVSLYADQAETVLCETKTVTASGEVCLYGRATAAGVASLRFSTLTADAVLRIENIAITPAVPRPT